MKKISVFLLIAFSLLLAVLITACNKPAVSLVEVGEMPNKTNYYIGDELDLTGCSLNIMYTDNSVKSVEVTSDMVSEFDSSSVGPKSVVITYREGGREYATSLALRVISRPPSEIRLLTPPTKSEYIEGEIIDLDGLAVDVIYTEERHVTVYARDLLYTQTTATVGTSSVTVSFADLSLDVPIRVNPVVVVGLEARPVEDNLYRNQTLTMGLFATQFVYNNGQKEAVLSATLTEEGQVLDTIGKKQVHISATHKTFGAFECTVDVEIAEDSVVSAELLDAPLGYEEGKAFAWSDVVLSVDFTHARGVRYQMGVDAYADLALSVPDGKVLNEAGKVEVQVLSGERALTSFVFGVGDAVPVRWRVEVGGDKVYTVQAGTVPKPDPLMLYAVMSDGTELLVWHRWKAAEGVDVQMSETAEMGQTTASIGYAGMLYTFKIHVTE